MRSERKIPGRCGGAREVRLGSGPAVTQLGRTTPESGHHALRLLYRDI